MPGQPVKIGPFVGGLNNRSLAGESKDTEVTELVNFELSLDTSLVSRPPLEVINGTASNLANQWDVLGVFRITASSWYVIVNAPTGATTYEVRAYLLGDFSTAPTVIKTTTGLNNKIVSFVQYNEWCYFNVTEGASDTGFRWKIGTLEAIATMPRGNVMISWEDRLWVTASGIASTGNYVYFSTVDSTGPKPNTWNVSVDFFNVDPGSGGLNTAMLALTNSLLIFKEDATYRFSFPVAPKNGDLSNMSRMIGAASKNSVIGFESYAFVYDQGRVYELINTKFTQINLNVDFQNSVSGDVDALAYGVDLSIVNRRLLVRYFNTLYSYLVDTRTWAQWQSISGTPGKFTELPSDSASAIPSTFISGSRGSTQQVGDNGITDPLFLDPSLNTTRIGSAAGAASINSSSLTLTSTGDANTNTLMLQDNIPVSPSRIMNFSCDITANTLIEGRYLKVLIDYTNRDGSTSSAFLPNANVEIRRNLTRNPRVGVDTTDWSPNASAGTPTIARIATGGPTESATFARVTAVGATATFLGVINSAVGNNVVTAGQPYTLSASFRMSISASITYYLQWFNSVGGTVSTETVVFGTLAANTWNRYSVSGTAPVGAVRVQAILRGTATVVAGTTADATAMQVGKGLIATSYLDGAISDNTYQNFEWVGTAHASESTVAGLNTPVGGMLATFTIPANAIFAKLSLRVIGSGLITLDTPEFKAANTASPVSLLRIVDKYQNTTAVEHIECWIKTKAYDYQANSVFKRLFLWGLDVLTTRPVEMQAIPLSKKRTVTWDELESYTWDQLEAGTADNPLSFLNISNTIVDITDDLVNVSENGRFFIKALKSLRFRQIQYAVKMTTLGNADTGPAKLFSITSYTKASQLVVDKAT